MLVSAAKPGSAENSTQTLPKLVSLPDKLWFHRRERKFMFVPQKILQTVKSFLVRVRAPLLGALTRARALYFAARTRALFFVSIGSARAQIQERLTSADNYRRGTSLELQSRLSLWNTWSSCWDRKLFAYNTVKLLFPLIFNSTFIVLIRCALSIGTSFPSQLRNPSTRRSSKRMQITSLKKLLGAFR